MTRKVIRCCHHDCAQIRAYANGYHVALHRLTEADAGVEPGCDDVCEAIIDHDLDRDGRMVEEKAWECRLEHGPGSVSERRQPEAAGRLTAPVSQRGEPPFHL